MYEATSKQEWRPASETYNQFLRQADVAFLMAVGKRVNARQRYCVCKVGEGAAPVLFVQGTDSADFSLNGAVSMDLARDEAVVVHLDFDGAYRGKIARKHPIKAGLMTVDLVADMILEIIGISRVRMVPAFRWHG